MKKEKAVGVLLTAFCFPINLLGVSSRKPGSGFQKAK